MNPIKPMAPPERWWPEGLGDPDAAGSQGELRYAYFAGPRQLAVHDGGRTTLYDTGDRRINAVSQGRQGEGGRATFSTRDGDVRLADLRVVTA